MSAAKRTKKKAAAKRGAAKAAKPRKAAAKAAKPRKAAAKAATPRKTEAKAIKPRKAAAKAIKPHKAAAKPQPPKGAAQPKLLSGGNPQIAMADGDAPVQAYIAAMPNWKREVGRRIDALITRTVPDVRKAVRWNSPFYGIEGQGWFLSLHCFAKYVKVAFFRGTSLDPVPPGESMHKDVRYIDFHKDDPIDEAQLTSWVKQASELPGWGKS